MLGDVLTILAISLVISLSVPFLFFIRKVGTDTVNMLFSKSSVEKYPRTIIYGAGLAGRDVVRHSKDLRKNKPGSYQEYDRINPIGFIDDDEQKQSMVVEGIRVLGGIKDLEQIIKDNNISRVMVAIAKVDAPRLKEVEKIAKTQNVEVWLYRSQCKRRYLPVDNTSVNSPAKSQNDRPISPAVNV